MSFEQHLDLGAQVWINLYFVGLCLLGHLYISDGYFAFLAIIYIVLPLCIYVCVYMYIRVCMLIVLLHCLPSHNG